MTVLSPGPHLCQCLAGQPFQEPQLSESNTAAPSLSGFDLFWKLEICLSWRLTKPIFTELELSSFRRTLVLETVSDEAAVLAAGVRHAF